MPNSSKGKRPPPQVAKGQIKESLRALYAETLEEELPDNLLNLLKDLQEKDQARREQ